MKRLLHTSEIFTDLSRRKIFNRYAIAVASVALATLIRYVIELYYPNDFPVFFTYYAAVMVTAWYGGFFPGFCATFLSAALGIFFFVRPAFGFPISGSSDMLYIILFIFNSLCISLLTENLHRSSSRTQEVARELLTSQRRIRSILESVQGCFFTVDASGLVIHVNKGCEKYLGFAHGKFFNHALWQSLPTWKDTPFEAGFQAALKTQRASQFEFYDPERRRWHEVYLSPGSDGVSIHLFDLTERKLREKRLAVEYSVSQILTNNLAPTAAISEILRSIATELEWEIGGYWRLLGSPGQLQGAELWVEDASRYAPLIDIFRTKAFGDGEGLPGQVWQQGKTSWVEDLSKVVPTPRQSVAIDLGLRSVLAFPVRIGKNTLGIMEFFSTRLQPFDRHLANTCEAMGHEIGQFLERVQAESDLLRAYEDMEKKVEERTAELAQANHNLRNEMRERRNIERQALEIIQEEQRKVSAQLHDGLCQNLTGIMMMAKAVALRLERQGIPLGNDLRPVIELIDRSVTEARDMARGLFPVEMDANALMLSLRSLAVRTQELFKVRCDFNCPESILLGDNMTATHLYRMAQEAVHNSIQHGNATRIEVGLIRDNENLELSVWDDGKGLSNEVGLRAGIGLHIMNYRARIMDAALHFEEQPSGTLFRCVLPNPVEELPKKQEG